MLIFKVSDFETEVKGFFDKNSIWGIKETIANREEGYNFLKLIFITSKRHNSW